MIMWSAVILRIFENGSPRAPRPRPAPGRGAGSRRGRGAGFEEPQNILLRDPTGEAATRDRRDVDLMLGGDLADQGSGFAAQALLGGLNPVLALHGRAVGASA